ncbi:endolytic transglycosylase MltG [Sporosarcina sp. 6E9]|uniref:endolytic transglycosylase MltG n=1 Tax=Sporosarcina sp. 6E9 TaxID=2819235 RepID=UPI001B3002D4|nr:endolytic transglycosylase MltG [Sporosarcina sp. 6E9]
MDKDSKTQLMFERMREKKKEVRVVRRIVLAIVLLILIIGFFIGKSVYQYVVSGLQPLDPESEEIINVEIPIGSGLNSIAATLESKGVIKDARLFKYYAKFNNESQFQAGTYDLTKAMTPDELIQSLKSGKLYREPVFTMTVPEGLTIKEIALVVEKRTDITAEEFENYVNDEETINMFIGKFPNVITEEIKGEKIKFPLEGYLFPATYPFYEEKPTVETVVDEMIQATVSNVSSYLNYLEENEKTVHWLLTFSSLLEKEATQKSDRATIASVFNNRMQPKNPNQEVMPLQTDPTVAYAHGQHLSVTSYADLEIDDPYNTYKYKGLPPGPIANAGKESIDAVIDPESTDYLYFLADKDGENHFSKTYEEHLAKRAKYIDKK